MSTKTENYQLHQWAAEDQFLRADFNEDHAKIDAAIKAAYERAGTVESSLTNAINQKASASALTALQGTVNNKADKSTVTTLQSQMPVKLELGAVGAYDGDGVYPRSFHLGFKPRVMFLEFQSGNTGSSNVFGGWFTPNQPLIGENGTVAIVTDTGFRLVSPHVNGVGHKYYYLALK